MELFALLGIGMLTFLAAAVQHLYTVRLRGVVFVMTDRSEPLGDAGFAGRAARALRNTVESAAMYAPAATALVLSGGQTPLTSAAAGAYLLARCGFLLAYWVGLNRLRSGCWAIGMAAILLTYAATAFALT
ncbi:MAPEG family protein [Pseudoruegeria sp. SHC-113]|uniref:MAPEG family protein n=1 Tax=Pseudoruegeria sp. SHC-113 TaxID=2855439 RepID=UPI0021BBB118|nr:MAPEG family protein [Pseudoruegeria sp. SHC-113]MCT8161425.1 MAPEG family protein [Pseudoruegeria sp. SHC-113]